MGFVDLLSHQDLQADPYYRIADTQPQSTVQNPALGHASSHPMLCLPRGRVSRSIAAFLPRPGRAMATRSRQSRNCTRVHQSKFNEALRTSLNLILGREAIVRIVRVPSHGRRR